MPRSRKSRTQRARVESQSTSQPHDDARERAPSEPPPSRGFISVFPVSDELTEIDAAWDSGL